MPRKKQKNTVSPAPKQADEPDSHYFLKLVLYIVLGSMWIKFANPLTVGGFVINGLPFGLLLGLIFASRDKFQVDRKIEYAILIMMTVLSYFLPAGIVL